MLWVPAQWWLLAAGEYRRKVAMPLGMTYDVWWEPRTMSLFVQGLSRFHDISWPSFKCSLTQKVFMKTQEFLSPRFCSAFCLPKAELRPCRLSSGPHLLFIIISQQAASPNTVIWEVGASTCEYGVIQYSLQQACRVIIKKTWMVEDKHCQRGELEWEGAMVKMALCYRKLLNSQIHRDLCPPGT